MAFFPAEVQLGILSTQQRGFKKTKGELLNRLAKLGPGQKQMLQMLV